ncbi:hypothetical protein [Paractinoplanes brasiliensis]|uniref:Uncharacterized protein n=1 Tax=Paractinoplanes brasiliensis TaxID=52695 RepID=A0A4V3C8B1_9ACTN|nr:hypothetical protein [Actinoplanes brasiliensis]TDO40978.1 hypothetical protein C8E87_4701 [Actinoplanes brasiliensis]GID26046.1 hypothetical protein Abr02nite_10290 [Actinoplanes brasiliensis]
MRTDVDLPAPGLLWTRWATLSAAMTGIGYADVWFVDDRGAHHDDHGGSWARLALVDRARAVLFGYDRDHSATAAADPPVDLLTDAPDWLPWHDLTALAEADRLGFVVWHAEGRWSRTRYRDGVADGLTQTVGPVLSNENTLRELSDIVTEWGRHELRTPAERDDVRDASEDLLTAAVRGEVTGSTFERLLGRLTEPTLDLRAALFAAGRGGITAGTRPPRIPAGERPPLRRVRRLSQGEHNRLVWAAMHDAAELNRPGPPDTAELQALAAWMRAHGGHSVLAYADATSVSVRADQTGATRQLSDLLRALRQAESDPRYGRWLFLRVQTTPTEILVERRYDSWPKWWPDDGVTGPWRDNLLEEMNGRAPQWRPAWVRLLDPEVAFRPA